MTAALEKVAPAWKALGKVAPLGPIKTKAQYNELVKLSEQLMEEIGHKQDHPLEGLLYIIGDLIRACDEKRHPIPDAPPVEVLAFLMEQHDLRQTDLPEIGAQSVVSAVLSGKRQLNARQIKALSTRFGVSADVFL